MGRSPGRPSPPEGERTSPLSRRRFVSLAAAAAAAVPLVRDGAEAAAITAEEVVARIRENLGFEPKPDSVDSFKAGDPATPVTGIVTTALPTLDVLGRAVKAGANLIVTSGPTFYGRADLPTPPAGRGAAPAPAADPVFTGKSSFITKHGLVLWRFSDGWRLRTPDPLAAGLIESLGWSGLRSADNPDRVALPEMRLDALAAHVRKALNIRGGMRVIGAPHSRVRTVALLPGSTPIGAALRTLPGVDVILAGEVREWESVEYVRDVVAAGREKGMILVGRIVSEDPGMRVCAEWLKPIVPETTVTWMPSGDPYWRPA